MVEAIQNYIGSLNWGYRVSLREKSVTYINSYGEFVEPHKIKVCAVLKILFGEGELFKSNKKKGSS